MNNFTKEQLLQPMQLIPNVVHYKKQLVVRIQRSRINKCGDLLNLKTNYIIIKIVTIISN